MQSPIPPRFDKKNQHFVPQSWISRFAGVDGRLACLQDGVIKSQVKAADIMSQDWLYTMFDDWWRPNDRMEDALSKVEGDASSLFDDLISSKVIPIAEQWIELSRFMALTACRHPDTMREGHERAKQLSWEFADIHSHADATSFIATIRSKFGFDLPHEEYDIIFTKDPLDLIAEAEVIENMSPWDPRLPQQISLEAVDLVASRIINCHLMLLDAPLGSSYVLSDRPMPAKDVLAGFSVPLSISLAFVALPSDDDVEIRQSRRDATLDEVGLINREQKCRAKSIVVGPDRDVLSAL